MSNQNTQPDVATKMGLPADRSGRAGQPCESGRKVHVDARDTMDRHGYGQAIQFAWRFVAVPDGSQARLAYSNLVRTSFVPDVVGQYLVHLEATTAEGVLQYVTRITVTADGRATASLDQKATATKQAETVRMSSAEVRQDAALKTFALSADGARRPSPARRRKLSFRRLQKALCLDPAQALGHTDPISTF